jgi:pyridoxine kinase
VLSGYLGNAASGTVVLDALTRVRRDNPAALYCCDPVMGDEGRGLFVAPDIPRFFVERGLPAADVVTPNQFELEHLVGGAVASLSEAVAAAHRLRAAGPSIVAVTSLRPPAVASGRIGTLVATAAGAWLAETPMLSFAVPPNGSGDVFAALLLGHLLAGRPPAAALERTVSGVFALLSRTLAQGSRELTLVASQDDLVNPRVIAPALAVG